MRTSGVVKWFDRSTGIGELALDDGGDCVVVRRDKPDAEPAGGAPRHGSPEYGADARAPRPADWRADWRADWPDVAAAARAGTWGDGGRDY